MDEKTAKYIMHELMKGIGYIHSRNVCHRDIKLENILLDNEGLVKLADFGISYLMPTYNTKMLECCGTPMYMAPEVIEMDRKLMESLDKKPHYPEGYTKLVDVWSAGIVLFALLYGNFPFKGNSIRDIKIEIMARDREDLILKPTISVEAMDLI